MKFTHLSFLLLFVFQVQAAYFLLKFHNILLQRIGCSGECTPTTPPTVNTITPSIKQTSIPILKGTDDRLKPVQIIDNDDRVTSSSQSASTLQIKTKRSKKGTTLLMDTSNEVRDVQPSDINTVTDKQSQVKPAPQVDEQFKGLVDQGNYNRIIELSWSMEPDDFVKQLCPFIKTSVQYKGIARYLRNRGMVASFYVYGDIEVVKGAIIAESKVYDRAQQYDHNGSLKIALPLALGEDRHDRVIELFDIRRELTVEEDKYLKQEGRQTSFEHFMYWFLYDLAPWIRDEMAFKRFLTFHMDELRSKHHDIFDTFCQELIVCLKFRISEPNVEKLLTNLIGQPLLLTSMTFAKTCLHYDRDEYRLNFIKYGWREAIQEGLKKECPGGGKKLWRVMKEVHPDQFSGNYPGTEETLAVVLKQFSTKQELEDKWNKENAPILFNKLKSLGFIFDIFPTVLWSIITEYAITLIDTEDPTASTK